LKQYLIELFEKHAKWFPPPADQSPVAQYNNVSYDIVRQAKNLRHFDELLTRRAMGYATVDCYYRDANTAQTIPKISIPTLCLSAMDDPICDSCVIPYAECEANSNVILAVVQCGGHSMDFYEGLFANRSWSVRVAAQYIRQVRQMLNDSPELFNKQNTTWSKPMEAQRKTQEQFAHVMERLDILQTRISKIESTH
jgi:predicted alpha/beta-fold hydrolase